MGCNMSRLIRVLMIALAASGSTLAAQRPGAARGTGPDARRCAALENLALLDLPDAPTRILNARIVAVPAKGLAGLGSPGEVVPPIPTRLKQYCQVTGYVAPQNKFELRLPLRSDWNQKFFFATCAGFCGSVDGASCNPSLARGYASVTTNGGHDSGQFFEGLWAASAPGLQEDYAWRGTHVVTIAAKAITTHFYEQPIRYSYIAGCSKGGHAVLKEAQQFPDDYDGFLPIAPVYDIAGRMGIAASWFAQAVSDGKGGSVLNRAAAEAVHKSVLARCGAQAGVDEGMVTDPVACDWRPEVIACAPGGPASGCLTPRQVDAVRRLMRPPVNSKGEVLYAYPYVPGTETEWFIWNHDIFANAPLADQFLRFLADAAPRKNVDPYAFNFDRDPAALERARTTYNATSTDLRAVKERGGKILMWHGLSDAGIMATSSIGYYERVTKEMGGREGTEDFFRLFLLPGVHHCGGGPGLSDFDALTLLERWVEKGEAPNVIIARRVTKGVVERSRPVYPYPIKARYSSGNPKRPESFVPVDPSRR